jgi:hypothetical protein
MKLNHSYLLFFFNFNFVKIIIAKIILFIIQVSFSNYQKCFDPKKINSF